LSYYNNLFLGLFQKSDEIGSCFQSELNLCVKIEGPLIKGRFHSRPNRFLTVVEINGELVNSHLPDPGRLKELLLPGAELYLRPVSEEIPRKTRFTTVMVCHKGKFISLVSTLPNRFVKESLKKNKLPMFKNYKLLKPEVTVGKHRFDFLLESPKGKLFYLEIKSVTYVENGIAQFPDAVTERGARHAMALAELVEQGYEAGILFVCQRKDGKLFKPMWERDPRFSEALVHSYNSGVKVWCIACSVTLKSITLIREIPVNLTP
jgi:sugar fermentation stimulation protein A